MRPKQKEIIDQFQNIDYTWYMGISKTYYLFFNPIKKYRGPFITISLYGEISFNPEGNGATKKIQQNISVEKMSSIIRRHTRLRNFQ